MDNNEMPQVPQVEPAQPTMPQVPAQPVAPTQPVVPIQPATSVGSVMSPVQSAIPGPIASNPVTPNAVSMGNTSAGGGKKKTALIIGVIVGAIVVIGGIALLMFLLNGGKTVSCSIKTSLMGLNLENETNIHINNGEISGGEITMIIDLKNLSGVYKNLEDQMVESLKNSNEDECGEGCTYDYDYVKGDYVKMRMKYDGRSFKESMAGYEVTGGSTQEVADNLQEIMESSGAICKQ